jgi:hypothetical protein
MAKFQKGQSGNPGGRPRAVKGLREALIRRYGQDGDKLVARLEALSAGRNRKIALAATELLLAYLAGKPVQAIGSEDGRQLRPLVIDLATDASQLRESNADGDGDDA